ncbi:MAG: DUF1732 domain-containing protein, partial [Anaerotignum sp.]|nr:DUF1732 domain-containing protein [Anaerotignum sp.]
LKSEIEKIREQIQNLE